MAIVIWVLRVFIFWENLKRAERGYAFVHERARSTAFLTRNGERRSIGATAIARRRSLCLNHLCHRRCGLLPD